MKEIVTYDDSIEIVSVRLGAFYWDRTLGILNLLLLNTADKPILE